MTRKCPICQGDIIYKNKWVYNRAMIKNTKCCRCVGKLAKHDNFRGHKHTDECNHKRSEKMKGYGAGRHLSEETKKKVSQSKKGQQGRLGAILSEETKDKIRQSVLSKHFKHSDETKKMLKELSTRLRKENPTRGVSKSATEFLNQIEELIGQKIAREFLLGTKEYDGQIQNILIEVDGNYWHSHERHKINDSEKNALAKASGYTLFRFAVNELSEIPQKIEEYRDIILSIKILLQNS